MEEHKKIVVMPIYTTNLSPEEILSVKRTAQMLGNYPISIVCPHGLDLSPLHTVFSPVTFTAERFDPAYFTGIKSYNRLMLSQELYARYSNYDYMLLCQADVFVFRDEFDFWCNKGYDYIGGPWIASKRTWWNITVFNIKNFFKKKKKSCRHFFKVGNGGFSLRRVATMERIVNEQRADIDHILENPNMHKHHIEDIYFSLVAPKKLPEMKIPDYKEALDFCFDRRPHIAYKLNNNRLPFACHGFNKSNVKLFWGPILKKALAGKFTGVPAATFEL